MLPAAIDFKTMKTLEHVARFAGLFTTDTNRLGNESLKLDASMEAIKDFLGGQVEREGDGEASSVDAEILNILSIYFTGKVNDLPAEENSDALLKRVNGWNKRPEKAATTAENSANKGQVKGTNSLADDLAKAREKHGLESAEAKACEQALMEYALSHIGK
jgi:hypothetical protein